jgi:hypothetical protein
MSLPGRSSAFPALALCLLVASGDAAAGEDNPAARARAVTAAFAAPSTQAAFEFAGYVLEGGAPYGHLTLSARPVVHEGEAAWQVRDAIEPVEGGRDRVVAEAVLDGRLRCLRGSYHRRNADGFLEARWSRHADGHYAFDYRTQDYENELQVPSTEGALTTVSGLLLFLRLAPARTGVYELDELDANPVGGDPLVMRARIEVHRVAPWRVRGAVEPAWIASLVRGKQGAHVALSTEDRSFLGMTLHGSPFSFVPRGSGPVGLDDPDQPGVATPLELATRETRRLRRALPVPAAPLDFSGDLRFDDVVVGTVRLGAVPASYRGRPCWQVLHASVRRTGAAEVRDETTGFLAQDLSTLRGERMHEAPSGRRVSTWLRREGGLETVHALDGKREAPFLAPAPADAITGLLPVLLFLRAVPSTPARYVLPGWDARWARPPKAGSGSLDSNLGDVHVEVAGPDTFAVAGVARPSWRARCSLRTGQAYDVHMDPGRSRLLGIAGILPRIVTAPAGLPGGPLDWYEAVDGSPQSARQVFIKFGRGYHLPRRDLLADAFHWPSMTAASIARGRHPAGTPESTVREDWIDVFEKMSKHRTKADCDDLLFQIFMTSQETQHADGAVTLSTLPAYGGHSYRMQRVGDRWYIVEID